MDNELTRLGKLYGTDKADGHNYTLIYENIFSNIRNKKLNILEIGSGDTGASHKMWKKYFHNSEVYCIDPFHQVGENQNKNLAEELNAFGVHTFKGNQLSTKDLENFIKEYDVKFDIIIDDAAHMPDAIQNSLGFLFSSLKSGGFYIVEDLITAWDRQNRIEQVNKNIEGILNIPHVVDTNLIESFKNYEDTGKWLSQILDSEKKKYLEENIQVWQFFDDTIGPSNLCIIQKK